MNIIKTFNQQLSQISPWLREEIDLPSEKSTVIASEIHREVLENKQRVANEIKKKTVISFENLLQSIEQSIALNAYLGPLIPEVPGVAFAHVASMNYVTFVLYRDNVYAALMNKMNKNSITRKCSKFFYSAESSAANLRHAISHGNWYINQDKIVYAYRDRDTLRQSEIRQIDLCSYYTLSRALVFSALTALLSK